MQIIWPGRNIRFNTNRLQQALQLCTVPNNVVFPRRLLGPAVFDAVYVVRGVAVAMPEAAAQSGGVLVLDRPGYPSAALPCRVARLAAREKHILTNNHLH